MSDIIEPHATIDPPRAIRVKTSTGWADLVIQGPAGPGVAPGGAAGQALLKASGANYDTVWGTAGADLIYNGDFPANTPYTDGDIVVGSDGIVYMCVTPTSAAPTPSPWPGGPTLAPTPKPPYGTTLPASPIDGQEAILVDSLTNPSYTWRLRYNAGSSSAYKWEYIGGTPRMIEAAADIDLGATTGTWLDPAGGPKTTAPRAGDYVCRWNFLAYSGAVSGQIGVAVWNGVAIGAACWLYLPTPGGAGWWNSGSHRLVFPGIAAGAEIGLRYYQNVANEHVTARVLEVEPRRLA